MFPFRKKSYRSIATTITVAFAVLSGTVLAISGALGMSAGSVREQQRISALQQVIARDAASAVRTFLSEKVSILAAVADTTDPLVAPPAQRQMILDRILDAEPVFRQVVLINNLGDTVAQTSSSSHTTISDSIRDEVIREVSFGKTSISPAYVSQETSGPFMIVAVPVTGAARNVQGALFAELDPKVMWNLVAQIKVGERGLAYVVDRDGYLVAFGDGTRVLQHERLTQLAGVEQFIASSPGTPGGPALTTTGIQGSRVVTSYAPLGTPDWAMFVEVPFWEAYMPTVWLTVQIVAGLVMSFILSVLLARFVARRLTRPIGYLRRAVQDIREGKLDTEIVIVSNDEIGVLGENFAQMVVELKKSRASLLAKIEELEKLNKLTIDRELRMVELKEQSKK